MENHRTIRGITPERFRLKKTSAIDTNYMDQHKLNPWESVKSVSHFRSLRLGEYVCRLLLNRRWTQMDADSIAGGNTESAELLLSRRLGRGLELFGKQRQEFAGGEGLQRA